LQALAGEWDDRRDFETQACESPHDSMRAADRTTILVIDDDVEMTEMLAEYLEPEGFAVEVCHDGDSGLKRATQGNPLLVVLDVMLPRLNGFEVLRRLRAASQVPVSCSRREAMLWIG
jgi:CheY-like chemotaxis protein